MSRGRSDDDLKAENPVRRDLPVGCRCWEL